MLQKNWTELIKPNKLNIQPGPDAKRLAKVVAEPLERGFGLTLGNALRRVLLSSLHGAAVTSIHVDGVLHEFSSIPGVREDLTDVVLNVKSVALRMFGDGPKRMRLRAEGGVRSKSAPHFSSSKTLAGASLAWCSTMTGLLMYCPPRMVSAK